MSGRTETWARVLTPVAVIGVVAVAIAVGVHSVADPVPTARELKRRELAGELASLEREHARASAALASAESDQADLQSQLDASRGRPNAEPLHRAIPEGRNPPSAASRVERSLRAVVQAADNTNNVYVVSAGSKDGVHVGMELYVVRGSDPIGSIVIDSVFPNYASAVRAPGSPEFTLSAGDACEAHPTKVRLPR